MWERRYGRIPQRAVVLMNSGWDSRYPDPRLVFNTDTPSDRFSFRFPTIHPAAAHFLVTQRDVIVVGVDTASLDPGFSRTFDTHVILGRANVVMLEHVANVGRLPPSGATVVVGLVKLRGGSGGPARVLAIMGDRCDCLVCVKRPRDTRALWTIL
ncbi:hypothetical protein BaRGS_00011933 [Batillaria attramentaria]|uniref:Uncharacterized protein n=1 Tax=Batillaria attramentaria TaxID=370345 RepID=A0ABD0LCG9_9CAEN